MSNLRVFDEELDLGPPNWETLTSYERENLTARGRMQEPIDWSKRQTIQIYTPSLARLDWDEKTRSEEAELAKKEELAKTQKPLDTQRKSKGRLGEISLSPLKTIEPLPPSHRSTYIKKKVQFQDTPTSTSKAKGRRRKIKQRKTKRRKYKRSKK